MSNLEQNTHIDSLKDDWILMWRALPYILVAAGPSLKGCRWRCGKGGGVVAAIVILFDVSFSIRKYVLVAARPSLEGWREKARGRVVLVEKSVVLFWCWEVGLSCHLETKNMQ